MKKLISLILSFVFMLLMPINTNAISSTDTPNVEYITVEECLLAGRKWIEANYSSDTEIDSVIPINNLEEELNGYSINFVNGGSPAGYLILNANKYSDSYIREFALDGEHVYAQLCEESNVETGIGKVIYSTNPFEYAIKYNTQKEQVFMFIRRLI